jgi:hypothetical protein
MLVKDFILQVSIATGPLYTRSQGRQIFGPTKPIFESFWSSSQPQICVLVGPKALCWPLNPWGFLLCLEGHLKANILYIKIFNSLLALTPSLKPFGLALTSQPIGSRDFPRPLASTPSVKWVSVWGAKEMVMTLSSSCLLDLWIRFFTSIAFLEEASYIVHLSIYAMNYYHGWLKFGWKITYLVIVIATLWIM